MKKYETPSMDIMTFAAEEITLSMSTESGEDMG